jgi:hypothetical protein
MHQSLADEADFQVRILHLPNLAALKGLEKDPIFSRLVLHGAGLYQNIRAVKS